MVTLSATPEPDFKPPRVRLELAAGPGSTLQSVEIKRDGKTIRQPPFAGTTTALAYDYEAPYGKPVTYTATGSTVGAYTNEWSESWANLTNWTGDTSSFTVSGGELLIASNYATARISRGANTNIGRFTVAEGSQFAIITLYDATSQHSVVIMPGSNQARLSAGGQDVYIGGTGPITVTVGADRIVARRGDSATSVPWSGVPLRRVQLGSYSPALRLGTITVAPTPATGGTFGEPSTATLSPDASWLIHPSYPSLSVPFEGDCPISMAADTRREVSSEAQRNIIPIQGSSTPVVVVNGRRGADSWTLALNCPTIEDRDSVRALLDDQTPILLRAHSPACDVPDGWYSVGDYGAARPAPIAANEYHRVTLPMQPVREPAVAFGNAGWDYSDVALVGTYATAQASFPTYLDLILGDTAA